MDNYIINIFGATATGKSAIAIKLADQLNTCLINADSSQIYKEAPILCNMPTTEDMQKVPHKLYAKLSVNEYFSVKEWLLLVKKEAEKTWDLNKIPIIVGGTGLYFSSLIYGISDIDSSIEFREQANNLYANIGHNEFFNLVKSIDYEFTQKFQDKQRLIRAYEVYLTTKKKLSELQNLEKQKIIQAKFVNFFVNKNRENLRNVIDIRFKNMLNNGALQEVEKLLLFNDTKILKKFLGATSLASYINKEISLNNAIEDACNKTKQYAKRQVTWFKHQIKEKIEMNEHTNILKLIKFIQ